MPSRALLVDGPWWVSSSACPAGAPYKKMENEQIRSYFERNISIEGNKCIENTLEVVLPDIQRQQGPVGPLAPAENSKRGINKHGCK